MSDPTTTPEEVEAFALSLAAPPDDRWRARQAEWRRRNPSSAPSEAGAQEADCQPDIPFPKTRRALGDLASDFNALTERVRVLEEALREIAAEEERAPLLLDEALARIGVRARKALSGGGEQHDE